MARTIQEIKKAMTDDFIANETIKNMYSLESGKTFDEQFSKVSLESILFYLHAVRAWVLETLFDKHLEEVDDILSSRRAHTAGWYRSKSLEFQFGKELSENIAEYDNIGMSDEEVESQRIVKKCSVEVANSLQPTILIKVAKEDDPLTNNEKTAFISYMNNIADAGIAVNVITGEPDRLVLNIKILYNPLVCDATGSNYIGGGNPVRETVESHLRDLPFNGVFYPSLLEKELMQQSGVQVAVVERAQASVYGQSLTDISVRYQPYMGALQCDVDTDLNVVYESF